MKTWEGSNFFRCVIVWCVFLEFLVKKSLVWSTGQCGFICQFHPWIGLILSNTADVVAFQSTRVGSSQLIPSLIASSKSNIDHVPHVHLINWIHFSILDLLYQLASSCSKKINIICASVAQIHFQSTWVLVALNSDSSLLKLSPPKFNSTLHSNYKFTQLILYYLTWVDLLSASHLSDASSSSSSHLVLPSRSNNILFH